MGKYCPVIDSETVYLSCQECEEKWCTENMFFCIVVGTRTFDDYDFIEQKLNSILIKKKNICIVSGGADGVDSCARDYAINHNYKYKEFKARWDLYGKSAGPKRNQEMCDYIIKQHDFGMIIFWDGQSKGTLNDINLAKDLNIPHRIILIA